MSTIQLLGGAYQARSVVAAAQRALNLYSEPMSRQQGEPAPAAQYPTPGLRLLCTLPTGPVRGIRGTTNGDVYAVGGSVVYAISPSWIASALGTITPGLTTPVSMSDNGTAMVIVDGSANGWQVDIASDAFSPIVDPTGSFRGGDRCTYLDTFFLFNVPGTPQFQASLSNSVTFDPLYFANKESYSDLLVSIVVSKREIWLIGDRTTEIWYNTGAADFPFASMPGAFVDHGCVAKYSVGEADNAVFWLSQDRQGRGIVLKGAGYSATRISNFALENAIASYATITDAIGFCYQQSGHTYYLLTFPSADKTWCYDMVTSEWHERCWLDSNGFEHRHRANCSFMAYNEVAVGDWQNGNIYAFDPHVFTDNGAPIKRLRTTQHILNEGMRLFHRQVILDMDVGNAGGDANLLPSLPFMREDGGLILREDSLIAGLPVFGGDLMREANATYMSQVSLRWSDDRGHSFGNPQTQDIGPPGDYRSSLQFQRLGMARDRIYEICWSSPTETVLQSAWLTVEASSS